MLNKLMGKNKTLAIFIKRCIKYIFILAILLIMLVPLLLKSYALAKQLVIDKSNKKLIEGIASLESQIIKAQEISNLLRKEDAFRKLFILKGFPSSEYYVEINTLQSKLRGLSLTQDMLSNVYIMYKENPIYISNYISSDNNADVYANYFNYKGLTANEWKDLLFNDSYILKFLPSREVFSSYYRSEYFEGLTCLLSNSYYDSINQRCIMAFVIDKKDILNRVLNQDSIENYFVYITDKDKKLLLSHNYSEGTIPNNVNNFDEITLSSQKYMTLTYTSEKLGLNAVIGVPLNVFEKNINSMLELVLIYVIIGTLLIVLLSLFFSLKETIWLKKLVEEASKSIKTSFSTSNEYSYINSAFTKINIINKEQLDKIEALSGSIKNNILKNLIMLGVGSENEKNEVEGYFNGKFDNFCIVKINYRIDELNEADIAIEQDIDINQNIAIKQGIALEIENTFRSLNKNEFATLNILSTELIFVIFLADKERENIRTIKGDLTELIRAMNLNSQIPLLVNIGISDILSGIKNAKLGYQQAKYAVSISENYISSGVYVYEAAKSYTDKKFFDIAVLVKLYDAIVAGEKNIVSQIFYDSLKIITRYSLTEQEQLQIFFSFRQTVYSTHKAILNGKLVGDDKESLTLPEYDQLSDILRLFNELNKVAINLCDIVINNKRSNNEKLKKDILNYIDANYADVNLCAGVIATELLVSEKYVFSFIKEQTGKSLGKYIEEVRIANSERLLLETNYSNSEISKMCGFGSESTYYRIFSKKHSVSPLAWRERFKPN